MFKDIVSLLVWLCSVTTIFAQESGEGYFSMTTQIGVTRNRLIDGEPMQGNPTAFYNGFKVGVFVTSKVAVAFEYSAFIYRWSNRTYFYDFDNEDWDFAPPTKGRKVNHYKFLVEFVPTPGLYLSAGAGFMNYRHFNIGYRDRGLGLYGSATYMVGKHIGISANVYTSSYRKYPDSGYFKAISAGLVFRINTWDEESSSNEGVEGY